MKRHAVKMLAASLVVAATTAIAQTPPPAYGSPITMAQAKKAMAAAEAEASKNNWPVAIAIVDTGGHLSMFQRQENTQFGSIAVAQEKANTAVAFRRPTKVFQDLIAQGGVHLRLLNLTSDAGVLEGAVPIVVDGKVIGGIGVSGVTSEQDAIVAQAGANALK
jgi:uncharacterized protein GlcG (DUF336 family)